MKHLKTTHLLLVVMAIFSLSIYSCKEDVEDPPAPNEEELITTVELTFTDQDSTSDVRVFKFADTDGDGGNAPTVFDTVKLGNNQVYDLTVRFLDESSSDVEDITEEVKEEADEHLVCYAVQGGTTVTVQDKDGGGLDLGLVAVVSTADAETGKFTISLKHQPDVKDGSCDKGETDVEVAFELEVE